MREGRTHGRGVLDRPGALVAGQEIRDELAHAGVGVQCGEGGDVFAPPLAQLEAGGREVHRVILQTFRWRASIPESAVALQSRRGWLHRSDAVTSGQAV